MVLLFYPLIRIWLSCIRLSCLHIIRHVPYTQAKSTSIDSTVCKSHITSSSHHMEKTEADLKGLYIRQITTVIDLLIRYY